MTPSFIIMVSIAAETSFASVMPEGPSVDMSLSGIPAGDASSTFEHHVSFEAYVAYLAGERGGNAPYGLDGDDDDAR